MNSGRIRRFICCSVFMAFLLTGCGNNTQEEKDVYSVSPTPIVEEKESDETQTEGPISMEEAKNIMINKYGYSDEELDGYDIMAFLQHYKLDRPVSDSLMDNPSVEFVRDVFDRRKGEYLIGGYNSIFGFLDTSPSRPITEADKFVKVGIELNIGDSPADRYVYDLSNKVYYHENVGEMESSDGAVDPMEMADYKVERIENIVSDCNILSWDVHTVVDDDEGSTGSYGWNIVFELEDGTDIAYKGFAQYEEDLFPDFVEARGILAGY